MANHPALLKAGREADLSLFGLLGLNALYVGLVALQAEGRVIYMLLLLPGALLALVLYRWQLVQGIIRYVLALTLLLAVCLQAYYSPGSPLAHANLFVSLCLLLGHEDWRLHLAAGAAFIAARLATPDWWPGTETQLSIIGLSPAGSDALMLAALSAVLIFFARRQALRSNERFELAFLVNAMGQEGSIRLNMDVVLANSAIGSRLKTAQSRMAATLREVRDVVSGVHDVSMELTKMSRELRERTSHTETGLRDAAMSLEQINVIVSASSSAAREARQIRARLGAGRARRRHRHPGRGLHAPDRSFIAAYHRHHRRDRHHCLPDQYPGPQCGGGSGTRRRTGAGLCGGRGRGAHAGQALFRGRTRDQDPDR